MVNAFAPVRGKCTFWRESLYLDDEFDFAILPRDKRVTCLCFVEGDAWIFASALVPEDCPRSRHCRYYIRCW